MAAHPVTPLSQGDLGDIQGLVLSGHGALPHSRFLFGRFGAPAAARAWLSWIGERVTPCAPGAKPARRRVQVALGGTGFEALGVPEETRGGLAQELRTGMASRKRILGDVGSSAPSTWSLGGDGDRRPDVLVLLYAADPDTMASLLAEHRERWASAGIDELACEVSDELGRREHFGFADGLSQPFVAGAPGAPRPGEDVIATGEFLLGHENAYGRLPASPRLGDRDLGKNGSYLVLRKLEQDVAGFWSYFAREARRLADDGVAARDLDELADWLAAKCVGRWRSGAPLVRAPERDDPSQALGGRVDAFRYLAEDPHGLRCPFGAHVRRANPRDGRGGTAEESLRVVGRHRMLRRGRPFGTRLPREAALRGEDDGGRRGLYFVSLQSSIARGFEFVQQTWLDNPGFAGLFAEADPVTSGGARGSGGTFRIPGAPFRLRLEGLSSFVTTRGGEYFFLPSRSALRALGDL